MKIEFSLLSIASIAFLLFFALHGGDVQIYSLEAGVKIDNSGVAITIDPVWVVWGNPEKLTGHCGVAFGNVAVLDKADRDTLYGDYLLNFEGNHVKQFYALGWWVYPASAFLPIDPTPAVTHWNDPDEPNRIEWLPPSWWANQWHFITIELK